MVIRPATPEDIPRLIALASLSPTAAHWTEQQYRAALTGSHPKRIVLIGEAEKIVGFAVAADTSAEWELENIVVDAGQRRAGLGSKLLECLLDAVQKAGGETMFLEVRASNSAARALYENWGFTVAGRRPGYYHNPPEDAILYKKKCSDGAPEIR